MVLSSDLLILVVSVVSLIVGSSWFGIYRTNRASRELKALRELNDRFRALNNEHVQCVRCGLRATHNDLNPLRNMPRPPVDRQTETQSQPSEEFTQVFLRHYDNPETISRLFQDFNRQMADTERALRRDMDTVAQDFARVSQSFRTAQLGIAHVRSISSEPRKGIPKPKSPKEPPPPRTIYDRLRENNE